MPGRHMCETRCRFLRYCCGGAFFLFCPVWKNNLKNDITVYLWDCVTACLQILWGEDGQSGGSQPVQRDQGPGFSAGTITDPLWGFGEVIQPLWASCPKWGHLENELYTIVSLVLHFYDIAKSADRFSRFYCMLYIFTRKQTNNSALIIHQTNLKLPTDWTAGQPWVRGHRFGETQKLMQLGHPASWGHHASVTTGVTEDSNWIYRFETQTHFGYFFLKEGFGGN